MDRAEDVAVTVMGRAGVMRRPSLLGALVAKAAALEIVIDEGSRRHLLDFVTLVTLIRPADDLGTATMSDRSRIDNMLGRLARDAGWRAIEGAEDGIARLRLALDVEAPPRHRGNRPAPWTRR